MALEEAAAYLGGDLVLPIAGKKYRVVEYGAEVGLRVEVVLNATLGHMSERSRQVLDDEAEKDLYKDVLGAAYDQLVPVVSWPMLRLCAITAMTHFNVSPDQGERVWAANVSKVSAGKASSRSSRPATRRTTAAASTTKPRASGSGTRSRRGS